MKPVTPPQRQTPPKGFTAEYDVKYVPDGDAAQAAAADPSYIIGADDVLEPLGERRVGSEGGRKQESRNKQQRNAGVLRFAQNDGGFW